MNREVGNDTSLREDKKIGDRGEHAEQYAQYGFAGSAEPAGVMDQLCEATWIMFMDVKDHSRARSHEFQYKADQP